VSKEESVKYAVHANDLVINRVNSPSHIGKCLLVPAELCPAVFESNMMRITISPNINPSWVSLYLRTDAGKARLIADAKWAVNQVSINQTDVVTTPVPVPPLKEQDEIVRRVEVLSKLADSIDRGLAAATLRAERLTRAVLAKAFRGELVPTEAQLARQEGREYEPASVLLERIKVERTKTASKKQKPSRVAKKT
jgi:type I restriction enzyme S subunit